jgi:hypothetical protein
MSTYRVHDADEHLRIPWTKQALEAEAASKAAADEHWRRVDIARLDRLISAERIARERAAGMDV